MVHHVRLFAGTELALARVAGRLPRPVAYLLAPNSPLLVVPIDDDDQDALHARHGTGEWMTSGPRLTTTDLEFARTCSRGTALAYLETDYEGGHGRQSAILWREGEIVIGPATLVDFPRRPPALWPINAALRGLGVRATEPWDEFDTVGLGRWRDHQAIRTGAAPVLLRSTV